MLRVSIPEVACDETFIRLNRTGMARMIARAIKQISAYMDTCTSSIQTVPVFQTALEILQLWLDMSVPILIRDIVIANHMIYGEEKFGYYCKDDTDYEVWVLKNKMEVPEYTQTPVDLTIVSLYLSKNSESGVSICDQAFSSRQTLIQSMSKTRLQYSTVDELLYFLLPVRDEYNAILNTIECLVKTVTRLHQNDLYLNFGSRLSLQCLYLRIKYLFMELFEAYDMHNLSLENAQRHVNDLASFFIEKRLGGAGSLFEYLHEAAVETEEAYASFFKVIDSFSSSSVKPKKIKLS